MNKRFKILDGALDYLRTTDEGDNPDAPAGTPLKLYQDWKKGSRNVTYTRAGNSLPGELVTVVINPFGLELDGTNLYKVPLSKRTQENLPGAAPLTAANIATDVPSTAKQIRNFLPAKATVSVPSGSTTTTPVSSKLTGIPYKPSNRVSYTFPYGKKTGVLLEASVRADITNAFNGLTDVQISFESEKL